MGGRRPSVFSQGQPTVREEVDALAKAGEITALVDKLSMGWAWKTLDAREKVAVLKEAIQVHGAQGTPALIDAVFHYMISFDVQFLLRCQLMIGPKLEAADRHDVGHPGAPPASVVKEDLPRLLAIEDRLVHLAEVYAKVRRVLAMADPLAGEQPAGPNQMIVPSDRVIQLRPEAPVAKEGVAGG